MASLAHSLLALAVAVVALLQSACTKSGEFPGPFRSDYPHRAVRPPQCATFIFGKQSLDNDYSYPLPPIHITQANSEVKIHDSRVGVVVIGEEITVCNRGGGRPPLVSLSYPRNFDLLQVMLGYCVPTPVDIEMYVIRFVKPLVPPHRSESDKYY